MYVTRSFPAAKRLLRAAFGRSASFAENRRANVSLTYAFALVPLFGLIGLGTDWYKEQSYKKRLDAASDAAALAAITTARAYVIANPNQSGVTQTAVAQGSAQAAKVFAVNAGSAELNLAVAPQINFPIPSNQTFTATVSYSTLMPTSFGRLVGTSNFTVQGSATSSLTMGNYIDFYVLLDVSGSMGIPTSTQGQSDLAQINPDSRNVYPTGCVFACHYPGSQGYSLAESNGIALRVDTVGQAVNSLLTTATNTEQQSGIANEFRIGLYPFIVHAVDAAPLNSNFTAAQTVANSLGSTYLDQGWYSNGPTGSTGIQIGSGGTHFENLTNDMTNYFNTPLVNGKIGSGQSASTPKAFLFLVTDGMDNNQVYSQGSWTGSQPQLPSTNVCAVAKSIGMTVAVLYIPYVPISNPNPSFAGDEDDKANNLVPSIPPALQAQNCASPGFFFQAQSQSDINNAMQTMFFQSLQSARLTQ